MSKLIDENIEGKVKSNIFYDSFKETTTFYKDTRMEIWEEAATISLFDTDAETGLFSKSDIIVVYDKETCNPSIVTERIYKKNYSRIEWFKMKRYLRSKLSIIKQELGYNIRVSYNRDYIDYVHYKEEWWQWAKKHSKQS